MEPNDIAAAGPSPTPPTSPSGVGGSGPPSPAKATVQLPPRPRSALARLVQPREVSPAAVWMLLQMLANHEYTLYQWVLWLARRNLYPDDCAIMPHKLLGHSSQVAAIGFDRVDRTLMATGSGGNFEHPFPDRSARQSEPSFTPHAPCDRIYFGSTSWPWSFDSDVKLWGLGGLTDASAEGTGRGLLVRPLPELVKTIKGHRDQQVSALAFSPDGKIMATGSGGEGAVDVKLWNMPGGTSRATLQGHDGRITAIAWAPNGRTLASASWDTYVRLWSARGDYLMELEHDEMVNSVHFSPDGKTLIAGCEDWCIKLWSMPGGDLIKSLHGHTDIINAAVYSPVGDLIVSASNDNSIKLWSAADGALLETLHGAAECKVRLGGKKRALAAAKAELKALGDPAAEESGVEREGADAVLVAVAGCEMKIAGLTRDMATIEHQQGHASHVTALCFSPDGFMLVTGGEDRLLKFWGMPHLTLLRTVCGDDEYNNAPAFTEVAAITFSPNGVMLTVGSRDAPLTMWHGQAAPFAQDDHDGEENLTM